MESSVDHAIYISVIEIDPSSQSLSIKTFSDDFVNALKAVDQSITIDTDPCAIQPVLKQYVEEYITLSINNKPVPLTFRDCHIESDTHWIDFQYALDEKPRTLSVETHWLTDLFLDQQNIIKVKVGENSKHTRLNAAVTSYEFEF